MLIFIKSSYGTLYIDTELSETIEIIKQKIEEKIFNEPERPYFLMEEFFKMKKP